MSQLFDKYPINLRIEILKSQSGSGSRDSKNPNPDPNILINPDPRPQTVRINPLIKNPQSGSGSATLFTTQDRIRKSKFFFTPSQEQFWDTQYKNPKNLYVNLTGYIKDKINWMIKTLLIWGSIWFKKLNFKIPPFPFFSAYILFIPPQLSLNPPTIVPTFQSFKDFLQYIERSLLTLNFFKIHVQFLRWLHTEAAKKEKKSPSTSGHLNYIISLLSC